MSNQAQSIAQDLMVGAGVLYFRRDDDTHGLHHLGNVDEFNITTDVTTVEKNSSMNKRRELMASVVTAVSPTATLTMTEYNPYNMALGLFGTEGVYNQVATTLSSQPFTVQSVPGVIELKDANGNRYMDVSNVTVTTGTATPASVKYSLATSDMTISTTLVTDDTLTDTLGGKIQVKLGTWAGVADANGYLKVVTAPTASGDLNGLVLEYVEGLTPETFSVTVASTTTSTFTTTTGLQFEVSVGSSDSFTANTAVNRLDLTAASTGALVAGKDYIIDTQDIRAGIIKIPNTSSIVQGDLVYVNASVPEGAFVTVNGSNAGEISGELLFIGDPNIGGRYNIEAWKVKVQPEGDFTGLIGTDFGSFTLQIRFFADYENHPTCPYYRATMIGRADGRDSVNGIYNPEY